ncbi:fatty acid desaturase [Mycolicibacterium sp.]|uniref:fatty acid desaturase family protein n=1 Tax=Mycolicibacterium sp. TaxID=2320850 RepID=UPI0028B2223A|nr:fatty acid desaturase [Mycolicibacterium sp.]
MAITDIEAFTHLTDVDIDALAAELDAIRTDVEESLGERDARYIHRTIAAQRGLEVAGRLLLAFGSKRAAWWAGTASLTLAKVIENMEIAHNVLHGQWDWMNDPEIHSSTWEWDMVGAAKHWRVTHNVAHHKYTNILGMDDDVGYGVLRVTRDEPWKPRNVLNLPINAVLALQFEWGIGLQHLGVRDLRDPGKRAAAVVRLKEFSTKAARQLAKDYAVYPALTALSPKAGFTSTLTANLTANVIRNIWANAVIFCGHFPDGAEKFSLTDLAAEGRGQWYLRQMLGSANIDAGRALSFLTGHLAYQVEHHLYPDLPSRRLAEISVRVRRVCEKYDLPYTTGPLPVQFAKTWRTIAKLSLPDRFLRATADDAPETRSERMFDVLPPAERPRGLKTALAAARANRRLALSPALRSDRLLG